MLEIIRAATWQNQQSECAPSEDSDQPGHPPSLIRVFTVSMKNPWVLSYPLSAQWRLCSDWADAQADHSEDSDQTGRMPMLISVFTRHTLILLVLSCRVSLCALDVCVWYYRKFPKYSDTQKICCNHSKIWTTWLYRRVMSPNDADGMENSVDPDQTAPLESDLGLHCSARHICPKT